MSQSNYFYFAVILAVLLIAGAFWYFYRGPGADQRNLGDMEQGIEEPAGEKAKMGFFITSVNPGRGGDLGGLAGADNYCQMLATSAGAGSKTWRAYLSAQAVENSPAVNARDRIGGGPWANARGVIVANSLEELHNGNRINKQDALDEKGAQVKGRGDTPNWHDILTGSGPDGRVMATSTDATCGNWTKSSGGSAMVGHHDRMGLRDDAASKSWNSSHMSRGCSLAELATSGSGGLFYCFAADN